MAAATALMLGGMVWGASVPAGAAGPSNPCAGHVVTERMLAPTSVDSGDSFTVDVVVTNCTGTAQHLTLEGRLTAPSPCFAPVVDPLPVTIAAHRTFTLQVDLRAPSCTGTYIVNWKVVRNNSVLADRERRIQITAT